MFTKKTSELWQLRKWSPRGGGGGGGDDGGGDAAPQGVGIDGRSIGSGGRQCDYCRSIGGVKRKRRVLVGVLFCLHVITKTCWPTAFQGVQRTGVEDRQAVSFGALWDGQSWVSAGSFVVSAR